jgi:DNA-binding transcriptional LysR family regulator
MNWGAFDLNLLIVFDAVMRERSVTRAGGRIGLSQPAVSHALSRLRHMLKDDLFVRTPEGMIPTPRAEHLAEPLRQALRGMELALEPETFVLEEATRRFVVAVNNYAAVVLAPAMVVAAASAAPRLGLDLLPSGTRDIDALLDRGEIDLAIGSFEETAERFAAAELFRDSYVAAMKQNHPARRAKLTEKALAVLPHLEISSSGEDSSFVDEQLRKRGLARSITHRAPHLSAAAILANSEMVAVLSRRRAEAFLGTHRLVICELAFVTPTIRTEVLWHRRFDNQPAHLWLRKLIEQTAKNE